LNISGAIRRRKQRIEIDEVYTWRAGLKGRFPKKKKKN
jgi:hypothetical protein